MKKVTLDELGNTQVNNLIELLTHYNFAGQLKYKPLPADFEDEEVDWVFDTLQDAVYLVNYCHQRY